MYTYYQTNEKGLWHVTEIPSGLSRTETDNFLRKLNAVRASVLKLSQPITNSDDSHAGYIQYLGDFYIDIDVDARSDTLDEREKAYNKAYDIASDILSKLRNFGIDLEKEVYIFLSGKKGFHIILPKELLGVVTASHYLVDAYRNIALFLDTRVDTQVYSKGKGVCWRLTGIPRPDGSGVMRTEVSYNEFKLLDYEQYQNTVHDEKRRYLLEDKTVEKENPLLAGRFRAELSAVTKELMLEREQKAAESVQDAEMADIFSEELPSCVKAILEGEFDISSFNRTAMQLGVFSKAVGGINRNLLIDEFVGKYYQTSDRYNSRREAREGVKASFNSIARTNMTFQCSVMRNTMIGFPKSRCASCELKIRFDKETDFDSDYSLKFGEEGTSMLTPTAGKNGIPVFLGWKVVPMTCYPSDEDATVLCFKCACIPINRSGETKLMPREVELDAEAMGSPNKFVNKFRAKGVVATPILKKRMDDLITAFQQVLASQGEEDEGIVKMVVNEVGLHYSSARDLFWVTPSTTFDTGGMKDVIQIGMNHTQTYKDAIYSEVQFPAAMSDNRKIYYLTAVSKLLSLRQPVVAATIFGWFMGTWLNPFFKNGGDLVKKEFPILNLFGETESGKTTLIDHFSKLSGLKTPVSLMFGRAGTSLAGGINIMGSTSQIPIVWEEVNTTNQNARDISQTKDFLEVIKNVWNGDSVAKSMGGGMKRSYSQRCTSPTILAGEVEVSTESVSYRSIPIRLSSLKSSMQKSWREAEAWLSAVTKGEITKNYSKRNQVLLDTLTYVFAFLGSKTSDDMVAFLMDAEKVYFDMVSEVANASKGYRLDERKKIAVARILQGIQLFKDVMHYYRLADRKEVELMFPDFKDIIRFNLGLTKGSKYQARTVKIEPSPDGFATKITALYSYDVVNKEHQIQRSLRYTDAELAIEAMLKQAEVQMNSTALLNDRDFKPVEFGEYSMFVRRDGYIIVDTYRMFKGLTRRGGDSTNFSLNSHAELKSRLQEMKARKLPFTIHRDHVAIPMDVLHHKGLIDSRVFHVVCEKYLIKLEAYNGRYADSWSFG